MSGDSSPLDQAVGRTSASEGKDSHGGADAEGQGAHDTPKTLWAAVVMMCLGAALLGLAVVLFSINTRAALTSLVAGVIIGLIGAFLGLRKGIMTNVE